MKKHNYSHHTIHEHTQFGIALVYITEMHQFVIPEGFKKKLYHQITVQSLHVKPKATWVNALMH